MISSLCVIAQLVFTFTTITVSITSITISQNVHELLTCSKSPVDNWCRLLSEAPGSELAIGGLAVITR
jgi:hypothetical protein